MGLSPSAESLEGARAVIVPVPYDGTTTYRAGTREGPRAILAASRELELFDEETSTEPHRWGIATVGELEVTVASPREMVARVRRVGESVLEAGKLPVLLGGEHLLSLGMIEAVAARFPDVTILHLDAHGDLRESYQGSPYSNACVMRLAADHGKL
ncbi:MAG: agmatinase, partial [Syntrophobacteraceae bacterium]|nr:agmatinase [Syntrophobacteraceae bacterium]